MGEPDTDASTMRIAAEVMALRLVVTALVANHPSRERLEATVDGLLMQVLAHPAFLEDKAQGRQLRNVVANIFAPEIRPQT